MTTLLMVVQMVATMAVTGQTQDAPTPTRPTDPVARAQFDATCALGEIYMFEMPPPRQQDPAGYASWRDNSEWVWLPRAITSAAAVGSDEDAIVGQILNLVTRASQREDGLA